MHGKGGLANDMVVWMGKWQRKKKRAVCPDRAFTNEQGARRSQAGWLHAGKVTVADPAFFGVSGTVLGGMEQSALSSWRTYPQCQVTIRSKCQLAGCNGMSICEVVNGV